MIEKTKEIELWGYKYDIITYTFGEIKKYKCVVYKKPFRLKPNLTQTVSEIQDGSQIFRFESLKMSSLDDKIIAFREIDFYINDEPMFGDNRIVCGTNYERIKLDRKIRFELAYENLTHKKQIENLESQKAEILGE